MNPLCHFGDIQTAVENHSLEVAQITLEFGLERRSDAGAFPERGADPQKQPKASRDQQGNNQNHLRKRHAATVHLGSERTMLWWLRVVARAPPIAQPAEATDLKSAKSGFESQWGDFSFFRAQSSAQCQFSACFVPFTSFSPTKGADHGSSMHDRRRTTDPARDICATAL